jgi:hypothetical protein
MVQKTKDWVTRTVTHLRQWVNSGAGYDIQELVSPVVQDFFADQMAPCGRVSQNFERFTDASVIWLTIT